MRPLRRMEEAGVRVTVVPAGEDGVTEARDMIAAFRKATRLVVMVHASNVSGALQPVDTVVAAARRRGILTLIDAAQSAGSLPIDLSSLPVDLLAASGHKGLLGPQGTGFLFVREGVPIVPLIEGGTGSRSESDRQPEFFPDALSRGRRTAWGRPVCRLPCLDPAKGDRDDPPQGGRPRRPAAPRTVENPRGDGLRAGGSGA